MNKLRVASLFSGCGGLDLGFEGGFSIPKALLRPEDIKNWAEDTSDHNFVKLKKTCFETIFANDIEKFAKISWSNFFENRDESVFHLDSIVSLVKKECAEDRALPQDVDVVIGGFPCKDFSIAGKRNGRFSHKSHDNKYISTDENLDDNRGMLYYWMAEAIGIMKPKMFVVENVEGLLSMPEALNEIEETFRHCGDGYSIQRKLLHTADFGVPQSRKRLVFIGVRREFLVPKNLSLFPKETHRNSNETLFFNGPKWNSCKEVLLDLKEPDDAIDESQKARSKAKRNKGQGNNEINLNGLAPTIRAEHHGNIEFRRLGKDNQGKYTEELDRGLQERRLTVRECARIQTFPDEFAFVQKGVSATSAYKLIGNAVPPLFSYHLARHLEAVWDEIF
jgi:DNA (cytosine-5)-methyltransferase 1